MTSQPSERRRSGAGLWARRAIGVVVLGAGGYGLVAAVQASMVATAGAEAARDAFLDALRAERVDSAYALLSSRRQAALSRDAFAAVAAHPALRTNRRGELRPPKQRSPGFCSYGQLMTPEGAWATEMFLVEDADGTWRVDAVAVQRPARVPLGVLLEECGYGSATLVGYGGPPVERLTPGP